MDGDEISELLNTIKIKPDTRTLLNLREAMKELEQIPFTGGIRLEGKNAGQTLALAASMVDFVMNQSWDRKLIRKEFLTMWMVLDAVSHRRRKEEKKKQRKKK